MSKQQQQQKQQSSDEKPPMTATSSGDGETICHDLTEMVMQLKSSILSLPLPSPQQPTKEQPLMTLEQQMRAFSQKPEAPVAPPMPESKPLKLLNMRPAGRSENLQRHCAAFPSNLKNAPMQDSATSSLDLTLGHDVQDP